MLKRFWLSFDLGIDGDYDTLFEWLDSLEALECGDNFCSFELEIGNKDPAGAILAALKKTKLGLRPKRDRIYLIWRRPTGAVTGKFIFGKRKRAPWAGYAVQSAEESEDSD